MAKKPKERTLWPEEEPNPNEPDQLVIVLPFAMPTWNRILQMQHFERMKLRHFIHQFVSASVCSTCIGLKEAAEFMYLIRPSKKNKDEKNRVSGRRNKRMH